MIGLFILVIGVAVFAALSVRFGVDSRIESTDPRRPSYLVDRRVR